MEFRHRGHEYISIENELIRADFCVSRGAEMTSLRFKPLDADLLFKTPWTNGLRYSPSAIWGEKCSDYFSDGWRELLLSGDTYGKVPESGESKRRLIPWYVRVTDDSPGEVRVTFTGRTADMPFEVIKTVVLRGGESSIHTTEIIRNRGTADIRYVWAQRPTYGSPLIGPNTRLDIPARTVATGNCYRYGSALMPDDFEGMWPKDAKGLEIAGSGPSTEVLSFKDLRDGWCAVTNPDIELGVGLAWDIAAFPYLVSWRALNSPACAPWFGSLYALSLEPWNTFLNDPRTSPVTKARDSVETSFVTVIYTGRTRVEQISPEGEVC
jgi:hypothetical protein